MEESKNVANPLEEQKNPFIIFFTNLISSIKLPFPPKKSGARSEPSSEAAEPLKLSPRGAVEDESKRSFVALPRKNFEQIKLEAEADEAGQNTNPLILWQVYALGSFLAVRWAWMKWNERRGQNNSNNDPPPAHD